MMPRNIVALRHYSTTELRVLQEDLEREITHVRRLIGRTQTDVDFDHLHNQHLELVDRSNRIAGELARRSETRRNRMRGRIVVVDPPMTGGAVAV